MTVKGNQGRLYEHLQTDGQYRKSMAKSTQHQRHKGRDEYRTVKVYRPVGLALNEWEAIASVLCIERWGTRKGKDYHQRYYISSASTAPCQWQSLVRGHWGIENRLHWPKDHILGEDDYRLEDEQALLHWSLFRTIAINVLRLNGFQSLKTALNRVERGFLLLT